METEFTITAKYIRLNGGQLVRILKLVDSGEYGNKCDVNKYFTK